MSVVFADASDTFAVPVAPVVIETFVVLLAVPLPEIRKAEPAPTLPPEFNATDLAVIKSTAAAWIIEPLAPAIMLAAKDEGVAAAAEAVIA